MFSLCLNELTEILFGSLISLFSLSGFLSELPSSLTQQYYKPEVHVHKLERNPREAIFGKACHMVCSLAR